MEAADRGSRLVPSHPVSSSCVLSNFLRHGASDGGEGGVASVSVDALAAGVAPRDAFLASSKTPSGRVQRPAADARRLSTPRTPRLPRVGSCHGRGVFSFFATICTLSKRLIRSSLSGTFRSDAQPAIRRTDPGKQRFLLFHASVRWKTSTPGVLRTREGLLFGFQQGTNHREAFSPR